MLKRNGPALKGGEKGATARRRAEVCANPKGWFFGTQKKSGGIGIKEEADAEKCLSGKKKKTRKMDEDLGVMVKGKPG